MGGIVMPLVDEELALDVSFVGQPEAARTLLGAIATLTMSVVGVAFSVTLVALQLASQQLSPRVLRTFRSDPLNQVTLGAFLGAATYALLVLRSVDNSPKFVPAVGVILAMVATVGCLALFVAFVANIVHSLQPATIIHRISVDGHQALSNIAHAPGERGGLPAGRGTGRVIRARRGGYVQAMDVDRVVKALARRHLAGRQRIHIGAFVVTGDALVEVEGAPDDELDDTIRAAFEVGSERTIAADAAFPLRQLADVALKALSPSLNDVTTAETALGAASDLLVAAASRGLGPRVVADADGVDRLATNGPLLAELVRVTFEQARGHIGGDVRMAVRMLELLARVEAEAARHGDGDGEAARQARLVVEGFESSSEPTDDDRATVRETHTALFGAA